MDALCWMFSFEKHSYAVCLWIYDGIPNCEMGVVVQGAANFLVLFDRF